jgi:hypothetical protein
VALWIVILIVVVTGLLVAVRSQAPEQPVLLQGMFRYEADMGWPRGVQEEDGERAWVPQLPARDPEDDELAWAALIGTSTMSDLDGDRPPRPVAVARVRGEVSAASRPKES